MITDTEMALTFIEIKSVYAATKIHIPAGIALRSRGAENSCPDRAESTVKRTARHKNQTDGVAAVSFLFAELSESFL